VVRSAQRQRLHENGDLDLFLDPVKRGAKRQAGIEGGRDSGRGQRTIPGERHDLLPLPLEPGARPNRPADATHVVQPIPGRADPGGMPPAARIRDRQDRSLPARIDADLRQVVAEPIGFFPIEKRSPEVPLAAAQETSDPAGDAASREEGSVRTVVEVPEL
jgi:hypothetical protein